MKLSDIKANPDNPRVIKDEAFNKLVQSIKDFPKMMALRPMVVDDNLTVLGGNMRLRALQHLGYKDIPDEWVKRASDLTEEEQKQFIIKDNVSVGDWDWDTLANEWDVQDLKDWGLNLEFGVELDVDEFGTEFSLPEGDREPFQQMTFTLADEQAEAIKAILGDIKQTEEYKYMETFGNENSNGNALYLALTQ